MKRMLSIFCRKRLFVACCAIFPALALSGQSSQNAANDALIGRAQAFLERSVKQYLQQNRLHGRWQVHIDAPDVLRAAPWCQQPLQFSLHGRAPIGRISLHVRCPKPSSALLLPARVSLYQQVLAARRPLKRGERLSAADVYRVERDIGTLPRGFLTDSGQLHNLQLTRALGSGQLLFAAQLKAAQLIARGEQVNILSESGGIVVQVSGQALEGGSLGQQIRVRNLSSQRILRARVLDAGRVAAGG